ncbi:MAG: polyisoprenoid-binding protein [Gemmatimonadetes bacterium]|nr:polyisoprenoid-binding protein [Gemmatimonadota bacterium]
MKTAVLIATLAAPALLSAQGPAPMVIGGNKWTIDMSHSAVTFRVRHLGLTWVNGTFHQWSGELVYDPNNPEAASIKVKFQTASVDTDNERRDNDVRTNYLVVDSFPDMAFTSTKVEKVSAEKLRISGDLTIRGIARPVVLDTDINGVLNGQRGRRVSFSATTALKRQDYGIMRNSLMEGAQVVGDDVRIQIDVEAIEGVRPSPAP